MNSRQPSTLDLKTLWRNVSASRGTLGPAAAGLDAFLEKMDDLPRQRLHHALAVCKKGSETPQDIELVAWASACTQSQTLTKARAAGIRSEPLLLFSNGVWLMDEGIDPIAVLLRPHEYPEVIARMAYPPLERQSQLDSPGSADTGACHAPGSSVPGADRGTGGLSSRELGTDAFESAAPAKSSARALATSGSNEGGWPARVPNPANASATETAASDAPKSWETVRLFGNTAAHTLEVSKHRRAGNFLGVGVVSIESARASQQGFDWSNKQTFQITPEEMPEIIAVLLGIRQEVTFTNHGPDRNKSLTFRNQDDGLQVVATRRGETYPVPVKRPVMYYLLDLFCRAMAQGCPDRKASDVISLVRGIYS